MSEESSTGVVDNAERQRFELPVQGRIAFADYRTRPGLVLIDHVETPVELRGGGVAAQLMQGLLEIVRARGLKIVPLCPYADAYIRRHANYQDLLG
ncbi:MAG TPA: GNAT family N-acetyltransferase [Caulobacteraceae bacterium]|nr:GNAT family N-acetyltransferase [Caulobacteraceae bacterium]